MIPSDRDLRSNVNQQGDFSKSLTISRKAEEVQTAVALLENICTDFGFVEKFTFEVGVCLSEALNNAIEHISNSNSDDTITIDFGRYAQGICITIRDRSPAYPPPDSALPADSLSLSGRGWHIMSEWLDKVVYRHVNGINYLQLFKEP